MQGLFCPPIVLIVTAVGVLTCSCGYYGVALAAVSAAESTSHFERRPQIPCRVFADPPGRRGGGGIGSSAVHIHYNHHAISS